jgi:hypothetical protein
LACIAQTMILRPLLNKIVPQGWDGENIPCQSASKYLKGGHLLRMPSEPRG